MESVDLVRDTTILRFDGVVVELFLRSFDKSIRVPAAWLGVSVKTGRHDSVTLNFGLASAGSAFYGDGVSMYGNYFPIETTVAEEPTYRAYFEQVAAAAGRTLSS